MDDKRGKISRDELTGLHFGFGYNPHYRYYSCRLLEDNLDRIDELFSEIRDEQRDDLTSMLEIELVTNAVQYCSDLAILFIASMKPPTEYLKTVSSVHDTGSGSVYEFYEKIPEQSDIYFWNLFGYNRIDLTDKEIKKGERSIERFKKDIKIISKYFRCHYQLYTGYKHGMRIFVLKNEYNGNNLIFMPTQRGDFDIAEVGAMWYLQSIEIVGIVHRMFTKIIEPLISWITFAQMTDTDFQTEKIKKTIITDETPDPERSFGFKFRVAFPWKIHNTDRRIPYY